MATKNQINSALSGDSGTGAFSGNNGPTITSPRIVTSILDTNGNEFFLLTATGSAINEITYANAAASGSPTLSATGGDTNISLTLKGKGTGSVPIKGASTNDSAAAGYVGEYISSSILTASAVAITSTVTADITSISLTAGDWDVSGMVVTKAAAGTTTTAVWGAISQTSATLPTAGAENNQHLINAATGATNNQALPFGPMRISLSGTTTIYLVIYTIFAVSTNAAYGFIGARRIR